MIGFITLGKFLEARSKLKTGEAIEKLMGLQVKNALVLRDGKEIEIPIDQVIVDDIVIIKPGQKYLLMELSLRANPHRRIHDYR